jgi:hypothetical protein
MIQTAKRIAGAVVNWARHREPVVVANAAAAAVVAAVAQWQGDLHGQAAWLAVAWGVLTFLQRSLVSPAS